MNSNLQSIIKRARKATPEEYVTSSIIRFGRHDNYIQEKLLVDFFAIKGNLMIIEGLKIYIKDNLRRLEQADKIKILDIGPAIGAISTLLTLQALNDFGLMDKADIYMLDASQRVLDKTQECDFFYPTSILNPELKAKMFKKLRESKAKMGGADEIPWKEGTFDIVLAGFLFHHLHRDIKPLAAKDAMRVLVPNGFIGIAEEWFDDYGKEYVKYHQNDQIPLAYEEIISFGELSLMFPNLNIFFTHGTDHKEHSYTFCGVKFKP